MPSKEVDLEHCECPFDNVGSMHVSAKCHTRSKVACTRDQCSQRSVKVFGPGGFFGPKHAPELSSKVSCDGAGGPRSGHRHCQVSSAVRRTKVSSWIT